MSDPVLFLIAPDWAGGVRRTLGWRTDVLVARDGSEQRRRLRTAPLETLTYSLMVLDEAEATALHGAIANAEDLRVEIPRWEDEVLVMVPLAVGATALTVQWPVEGRHIAAGQRCVLFIEDGASEVVVVQAAAGTSVTLTAPGTALAWPAGARLAPLVVGRIDNQISGRDHGGVKAEVSITVVVEEDIAGLGEGGEASTMVATSIEIQSAYVGSRDSLPRNGILPLMAYAYTAAGILIPRPAIAWSITPDAAISGYPSGRDGMFLVHHTGKFSGGSATITATVDGVSATLDVEITAIPLF
jgi:hypothetical protein